MHSLPNVNCASQLQQWSAHYVTAACDKKSLPTTVHVRPSNINCNSLRADFSLTKYNPTVLLGWVVHATPLRPCC